MSASPLDLTTLSNVKSWLSSNGVAPSNTSDDENIQACITTLSIVFLWRTAMANQDGSLPSATPFASPQSYNETYDGNDSFRLFLDHRPIQTVTSLIVGNTTIPQSAGFGSAGWVVDGSKASIAIRGGGGGNSVAFSFNTWGGMYFCKGIQNVNVQYTAGFTSEPLDIELGIRKSAALTYKRKDWIGLRSKAMAQGAGTTSYQDYELEPDVERLITNYTRWSY